MDKIFAHFISRGDHEDATRRLAYASWFVETIPLIEFDGDEKLFTEYLEYSVTLGVPIKLKYFDIWLSTELREVLHKLRVKVAGCENLNFEDPASFETLYRTTVDVMHDNFNVLEAMPSELDDFKVEIAAYFSKKRGERLTQALSGTFDMLNDTSSVDEAADYALDNINAIKEIYDTDKLEDLDANEGRDLTNDLKTMVKVSDSGLPAIDTDSGGLYTSQLLGIEAQPGTGKTRFALGTYCYRAATVYKKNVLFCTLEQKEEEIKAMLLACHVFRMFNIQISDKMIVTDNIPDEIRPQVEAAKFDLFESGKYGKLIVKELDLYVETFIVKMRTLDKLLGPFDLIAIDYMGLIESKPAQYQKEKTEYEIIKTAFKQFKKYLRHTNKAGIAISQFNRDGIQAGKNDKEITTEMAQGGIAVYRNTDYNIAISMTETMRLQQKRRFSQPKVRSSAGFHNFLADVRLGFCYFNQIAQKAV